MSIPILAIVLNTSDSCNLFFTRAPSDSMYLFAISTVAAGGGAVPVEIYQNGKFIIRVGAPEKGMIAPFPQASTQIILDLKAGETVQLKVPRSASKERFKNRFRIPTDVTFTGHVV